MLAIVGYFEMLGCRNLSLFIDFHSLKNLTIEQKLLFFALSNWSTFSWVTQHIAYQQL